MFENQPKKESEECEIRARRDKRGRVVGIKVKGKCTKEDRMIFARENKISHDEYEEFESED